MHSYRLSVGLCTGSLRLLLNPECWKSGKYDRLRTEFGKWSRRIAKFVHLETHSKRTHLAQPPTPPGRRRVLGREYLSQLVWKWYVWRNRNYLPRPVFKQAHFEALKLYKISAFSWGRKLLPYLCDIFEEPNASKIHFSNDVKPTLLRP